MIKSISRLSFLLLLKEVSDTVCQQAVSPTSEENISRKDSTNYRTIFESIPGKVGISKMLVNMGHKSCLIPGM